MDRSNTLVFIIFAVLIIAAIAVAIMAVRDNQGVDEVDNTTNIMLEESQAPSPSSDTLTEDESILPETSPVASVSPSPTASN